MKRARIAVVVLLLLVASATAWLLRDPTPYFMERRSQLVSVEVERMSIASPQQASPVIPSEAGITPDSTPPVIPSLAGIAPGLTPPVIPSVAGIAPDSTPPVIPSLAGIASDLTPPVIPSVAGIAPDLTPPVIPSVARDLHFPYAASGPAHEIEVVRLQAANGLEVELTIKRPAGDNREPRPLVLLLGGHRTGRAAAELIPDTRGFIVAALAYPYQGEHRLKGFQVVRAVPAIRRAVFDTPPAVMLALDYLTTRPDVDSTRVEAVGVSLGVPFVTIAAALDQRIKRVWAVHGTGGIYEPMEHNLRRNISFAPARVAVAALATLLINGPHMAPEQWVSQIAPRPFIMLAAEDDERLPRAAVERLYDSAGQPKSLTWMPGGHVRSHPEIVRELAGMVFDRMM